MRVNRVSHQSLRLGPAVAADRKGGLSTALIDISSPGKLPLRVARLCRDTKRFDIQERRYEDSGGDVVRLRHCLQPHPADHFLFFLLEEAHIPALYFILGLHQKH